MRPVIQPRLAAKQTGTKGDLIRFFLNKFSIMIMVIPAPAAANGIASMIKHKVHLGFNYQTVTITATNLV